MCTTRSFGSVTQIFETRTIHSDVILPFLSGGAVGLTSSALLYPLNFCNTRISVDIGDNKMIKRDFYGLRDCLSKVYKTDGYRGFYQGLSSAACGLALYRSIYFGVYTFSKRLYTRKFMEDSQAPPFFVSLILAQSSSIFAISMTYPLDTLSRQKMLWSGRGTKHYVTVRQMISIILKKDGPIGFYKGISANLMSTICGALLLVTYDIIKKRFDRFVESKRTKSEN
ncbi:unnamed protein product [Xylocopa violacea]|uniref:ADP/ATP translocase n=1 Tax=Xylocopa violacea TaxID=135666 RepID=A0ABP1PCW9_XYLVO